MFYVFKQKSKLHSDAKHHSLFSGVLLVKGSKMLNNYNFELCVSLNCYKLSIWFGENNWYQLRGTLFNLLFFKTFYSQALYILGKKLCARCIYWLFCKLKSSSVNKGNSSPQIPWNSFKISDSLEKEILHLLLKSLIYVFTPEEMCIVLNKFS